VLITGGFVVSDSSRIIGISALNVKAATATKIKEVIQGNMFWAPHVKFFNLNFLPYHYHNWTITRASRHLKY